MSKVPPRAMQGRSRLASVTGLVACVLAGTSAAASEPLFDMHVHLYDGEMSLEAYDRQNHETGTQPTAFGAMWFGGPNQAAAGEPAVIRQGNDAMIALAQKDARVVPIGTVHPYDGEAAISELERIAGRGVEVLKLHPHTQRFDISDPRVASVVARAGELGVVVLFDNAAIVPGDNAKLLNLALAHPSTKFVLAHMGALEFRFWNLLPMARTADGLVGDNIYFDISAIVTLVSGSPLAEEFVWTVRNVGVENVLIGSDFPQFSLRATLDALDRLPFTEAEKNRIRGGTARDLFGPKP